MTRMMAILTSASVCALALAACGDNDTSSQAELEAAAPTPEMDADPNDLPDPAMEEDMAAVPDTAPPPALDVDEPYDPEADYGEPGARADFEFAEEGSGTAWFFETGEGVRVYALVRGMSPGGHAIHLHVTGDCSAPDFSSAGGHLGEEAGMELPDKPDDFEAGVLPDLTVGDDGSGTLNATLEFVTFSEDTERTWPMFDADGAAIVIHRYASGELPAGEDNPRIACGEIFESSL